MKTTDSAVPTYYVVRIPSRCVSEHDIDDRSLMVETALNTMSDETLTEFGRRIGRGGGEHPMKCASIRLSPFSAERIGHLKSIGSHFSVSALVANLLSP